MKLTDILPILSLTTLAHSTSTKDVKTATIPYGAFPSPTSSTSITPISTPKPASNDTGRLGRAVVANHCNTPVYVWSVGSVVQPRQTILQDGRYSETFRRDPGTGGIAIKISTVSDGLYSSAPQTIFAYNLNDDKVWYDLSDVFGDPFEGHPVVLQPAEPQIYWQDGVPPAGSQVRENDASGDLVLTLC